MVGITALRVLAACSIFATVTGARAQDPPRHLTLILAEVAEIVPPGRFELRDRQVMFSIRVAAAPPCSATRPNVSYTFLLDTDRSTVSGTRMRGFAELGIDRRLTIRCDSRQGRFVSSLGSVSINPGIDRGTWELSVVAPLRVFPSTAFQWVAIAREGNRYDRLPEAGRAEHWSVMEGPR